MFLIPASLPVKRYDSHFCRLFTERFDALVISDARLECVRSDIRIHSFQRAVSMISCFSPKDIEKKLIHQFQEPFALISGIFHCHDSNMNLSICFIASRTLIGQLVIRMMPFLW